MTRRAYKREPLSVRVQNEHADDFTTVLFAIFGFWPEGIRRKTCRDRRRPFVFFTKQSTDNNVRYDRSANDLKGLKRRSRRTPKSVVVIVTSPVLTKTRTLVNNFVSATCLNTPTVVYIGSTFSAYCLRLFNSFGPSLTTSCGRPEGPSLNKYMASLNGNNGRYAVKSLFL